MSAMFRQVVEPRHRRASMTRMTRIMVMAAFFGGLNCENPRTEPQDYEYTCAALCAHNGCIARTPNLEAVEICRDACAGRVRDEAARIGEHCLDAYTNLIECAANTDCTKIMTLGSDDPEAVCSQEFRYFTDECSGLEFKFF